MLFGTTDSQQNDSSDNMIKPNMDKQAETLEGTTDETAILDQPTTDTSATDDASTTITTDDADIAPYVDAITPTEHHVSTSPVDTDDLLTIKQRAITDLTPLVDQLDQTPEEKYRTTMMMIQSTDNSALIKEAYAAAQAITDDKVRAQALLDIVNEINYFTQPIAEQ